jgi:hypothetical protein
MRLLWYCYDVCTVNLFYMLRLWHACYQTARCLTLLRTMEILDISEMSALNLLCYFTAMICVPLTCFIILLLFYVCCEPAGYLTDMSMCCERCVLLTFFIILLLFYVSCGPARYLTNMSVSCGRCVLLTFFISLLLFYVSCEPARYLTNMLVCCGRCEYATVTISLLWTCWCLQNYDRTQPTALSVLLLLKREWWWWFTSSITSDMLSPAPCGATNYDPSIEFHSIPSLLQREYFCIGLHSRYLLD